jgi:hypothetical protein
MRGLEVLWVRSGVSSFRRVICDLRQDAERIRWVLDLLVGFWLVLVFAVALAFSVAISIGVSVIRSATQAALIGKS